LKYQAVIFDLFGTLVENFSIREHEGVLTEMASVLAAPPDEFIRLWIDTFHQRATGALPTPEAEVEYICQELGTHVDEAKVKLAAQIRTNYTVRSLTPRTGSAETLSHLKSKGLKTGLISDCSREVPASRIYQIATEKLGVEPHSCLYIGDGSSRELTGASQVGMHPVLLRVPDKENTDFHQIDREDWEGPAISSLSEVLTLLGEGGEG